MAGLEDGVTARDGLTPPAGAGPPVLEVVSLAPEGSQVPSVSLELRRGEALTLLSIDGNGADVFAAAIGGLRPADGIVRIDGRRVRPGDPESFHEAGGAVIPADRLEGLFPNLSLLENFAVASRRGQFWLKTADLESEAARRCSDFSIRARGPGALARELSGGNPSRRVLLARALTPIPRLLIAISPARGLDLGSSAAVRDRLRDSLGPGTSVLLVTSDPDEARLFGAPIRIVNTRSALARPRPPRASPCSGVTWPGFSLEGLHRPTVGFRGVDLRLGSGRFRSSRRGGRGLAVRGGSRPSGEFLLSPPALGESMSRG